MIQMRVSQHDGVEFVEEPFLRKPIVILDLVLPEVSGFQLLAEWRANSRTAELPIFVLTSKDLTPWEQDHIREHTELLLHKQQRWQEALIANLQRTLAGVASVKS